MISKTVLESLHWGWGPVLAGTAASWQAREGPNEPPREGEAETQWLRTSGPPDRPLTTSLQACFPALHPMTSTRGRASPLPAGPPPSPASHFGHVGSGGLAGLPLCRPVRVPTALCPGLPGVGSFSPVGAPKCHLLREAFPDSDATLSPRLSSDRPTWLLVCAPTRRGDATGASLRLGALRADRLSGNRGREGGGRGSLGFPTRDLEATSPVRDRCAAARGGP